LDILKSKININRYDIEIIKPIIYRNEKIKFETARAKQPTNKFNSKNARIKSKSINEQFIQ